MSQEFVRKGAQAFNKWFNTTIANDPDASVDILPELMAILYIRLRLWFDPAYAHQIMHNVIEQVEELIEAGTLLHSRNGVEVPFRPAESFESEEDRQFYIDASWGLSEDDFQRLLEDE